MTKQDKNSKTKTIKNTLLTPLQLKVLELRAKGLTFDEIARVLRVSKASAYTVYKKALNNIEKARNTLRVYTEVFGGIEVDIPRKTPINNIISIILQEADIHGIKIRRSSSSMLLYLFKKLKECFDLEKEVTSCNIRILIKPSGDIEAGKS